MPVWRQLPVGKKIVLLHFKCLKFKYFQMWWFRVYPQSKLWGTKTSLICSRSTNEIFCEPLMRKKKNVERKQFYSQPPSSGVRNDHTPDYFTIYNQRHPKLSKNDNWDQFCPTFMETQPGIHSCSIHPLKSWIHQAAG